MTARPGRIKRSMAIDIARPRTFDVLTLQSFVDYKRQILTLMHREAEIAAGAVPAS